MSHVGEFMKIHGAIIPYTQQIITESFFRSSNHQGETALRQIIEKQKRVEHLETIGVKRSKL